MVTKVKDLGNGEMMVIEYQAPARRKMSYGLALFEELNSQMEIASNHVLKISKLSRVNFVFSPESRQDSEVIATLTILT